MLTKGPGKGRTIYWHPLAGFTEDIEFTKRAKGSLSTVKCRSAVVESAVLILNSHPNPGLLTISMWSKCRSAVPLLFSILIT